MSHVPYFLETLKRKLYRKKIPENAIIVTQVTRDGRTWTLWTPFPVIPESLTRKMYREKIPGIVQMVSMVPGPGNFPDGPCMKKSGIRFWTMWTHLGTGIR